MNRLLLPSIELAKQNERFKMFKTAIPRSEIEAVWSILGYFGRMKSPSSDVGHRWRLFISLFLSQAGVLGEKAIASSDKTISPLPPCNEHLTSCATEIKFLSLLLKSRNLDPLPPNDTIFEKLFMKSVGLQADSLQYDNNARESFLNNYHEKSEMRTIRNLWESSDLINLESLILTDRSYTPQDMIQRLFYELSDIRTGEEILYQGPSSIMIRSCVSLCLAWELGCTKKARKIRCNKVVSELVNRLVTEAKSFEQKADLTFEFDRSKTPNSCVDDFARSFSASANVKQNVDPGSLAVANFYRETAAFLLLSSTAVKATSDFVTMSNHFTDPKFHQKVNRTENKKTGTLVTNMLKQRIHCKVYLYCSLVLLFLLLRFGKLYQRMRWRKYGSVITMKRLLTLHNSHVTGYLFLCYSLQLRLFRLL